MLFSVVTAFSGKFTACKQCLPGCNLSWKGNYPVIHLDYWLSCLLMCFTPISTIISFVWWDEKHLMLPSNVHFSHTQTWYDSIKSLAITFYYKNGRKRMNILLFYYPLQLVLGEEVALSKLTLMEIINKICDGVQARAELGLYSSLHALLQ
jgi:hypothetical protein